MKNTAEKVTKLLIGEKVKRLRNTHALTKERLAEKAEVDVKTIHRLEKGEGASPDTLQRVAEAFGGSVMEFTMLNLDYGSLAQRSSQELSSIKGALYELLEIKKINSDEHHEMRELIEKLKVEFTLPPLPPPPEGEVDSQNDPTQPLEKLDLGGAIIRVLKETKPWVKYAPVDKNKPALAHRLHDYGFKHQPYFCDLGQWRLGLFKHPHLYFSDFANKDYGKSKIPGVLYLALCSNQSKEGLVVRLWDSPYYAMNSSTPARGAADPFICLAYRSEKLNTRHFVINLEKFEIDEDEAARRSHFAGSLLLDATQEYTANFELIGGGRISNAYEPYSDDKRSGKILKYNPGKLIKENDLPPVYIPWNISLKEGLGIVLQYFHPIPIWFRSRLELSAIQLGLGPHIEYSGKSHDDSCLSVSWPRINRFEAMVLLFNYYPWFRRCVNKESIDLIAKTDEPIAKTPQ